MAVKDLLGIGVDIDVDRLADPHVVEVRFLEIGRHPDMVGDQRHQVLADLNVVADSHTLAGDTPGEGGTDPGVGQVEARLLDLRLRRAHAGFGSRDLGLVQGQLGRGHGDLVLRGGEAGGSTTRRGGVVVELLPRQCHRSDPRQLLGSLQVRRRVRRVRLGHSDLGLRCLKIGLRHCELRLGLCQLSAGALAVGDGLVELRLKISRVELDERLASQDLLVIVDLNGVDAAGDLRADLYHMHVNERVVGADPVACLQPPTGAAGDGRHREQRDEADQQSSPPLRPACRQIGRLRRCRAVRRKGFG